MKPLPLRTSLTLAYTGLLAVTVTAVAFGYHRLLIRQVDLDATAGVEELERGLHGYLQFKNGQPAFVFDQRDADAAAFIGEATSYYQVYDLSTGRLLAQSPSLGLAGVDYTPAEVFSFREPPAIRDVQTDRGRLRISSSVVNGPGGHEYLLQVGLALDRTDRSIASLERLLLWGIVAGLLLSALVGRWMAGRALAPLSRLAEATRPIDINTLSRRLPVRGAGDELDEVTHAFNLALDRVERAVGDMRQFSAALAHELRTPLSILRGETELALRQAPATDGERQRLENQLEEFDRLNALITQVLTLARAEAGQIALAHTSVDLSALATATVEQIEPVADVQGIALSCAASPPVLVTGDAGWLERLLLILLDNAIKFTPRGGQVHVELSGGEGVARLSVTDNGIGIPEEALARIFDPFFRGDPARSRATQGGGLGLALARWVATQHRGTIDVASRSGHGSRFTVSLPTS